MGKVKFEFDPFELVGINKSDIPKDSRDDVLSEIADYVLESVLSDVGSSRSPVTGRAFQGLSPEYKKRKIAEGGTPVPNLLLDGDMLDALTVKRKGDKLVLEVDGTLQDKKADNHNHFGAYGDPTLPARKFIPNADEGETFRPAIREGIKAFIRDALE